MTFKIEAGKRYVAINGVVTGPLVAALAPGTFKCPEVSIGQVRFPSVSQIWNDDGTVYQMEEGESEHGLIAEYVEENTAIPPFPSGNLNDIVPPGYYSVKGVEANLPRYSGDGTILIPFPEESDLYMQYLVQDGKYYVRHFLSEVWTSWSDAEGVISRAAGSGARGGINASPSAFDRIAELEGVNSSLELQLFRTKNENADLSRRIAATEAQRKHWHDEWQKEKRKNLKPSPFVPVRHPKAWLLEGPRSFASGGFVGVTPQAPARDIDARIDNAFKSLDRLKRTVDSDRDSFASRALFAGALSGALVVAVAFSLLFIL